VVAAASIFAFFSVNSIPSEVGGVGSDFEICDSDFSGCSLHSPIKCHQRVMGHESRAMAKTYGQDLHKTVTYRKIYTLRSTIA